MKNKVGMFIICAAVCLTICFCRILSGTVCAAEYEYDKLGRVTKVTYEDNSSVTYVYDANGNIVSVTRTEGEPGTKPNVSQEESTSAQEEQTKPQEKETETREEETKPQKEQTEPQEEETKPQGEETKPQGDNRQENAAQGGNPQENTAQEGNPQEKHVTGGQNGGREDDMSVSANVSGEGYGNESKETKDIKDTNVTISGTENRTESERGSDEAGFWRRVWNAAVSFFQWIWFVIKSFFLWLWSLIKGLFELIFGK